MLLRELRNVEDFLTVEIENKEYVIDYIKRKPNCSDAPSSYLCLVCKDCGIGEVRR